MRGSGIAGRIALVTGASRGVGGGVTPGLVEAGATVYVTGQTLVAAELTQEYGFIDIGSRRPRSLPPEFNVE